MKNLKNALVILVVLAVAAFFVSCGNEEAQTAETPAVRGASVEDTVDGYFANMPDHIYKIGHADFVELVASGSEMTILDIRRADDYAAGHIEGAVNLAWGSADLVEQVASIPQDGDVFVYCYSGQTAGQAVALFNMVGIPARSVNLGFNYGISKVEGYEEYVGTNVSTLADSSYEIDANLLSAYEGYYADMADASGTNFASNIVSEANAKAIFDAADPDVAFVSIRQAEHYAESHIDGAVNIPWGAGMETMFDSLPADKKIVVYCYSGQTAGQAVAMLRVLGYDAVSLKGGMGVGANAPMGWANQGFPTVSS